jgi:hypothetical protein
MAAFRDAQAAGDLQAEAKVTAQMAGDSRAETAEIAKVAALRRRLGSGGGQHVAFPRLEESDTKLKEKW